MPAPLGTYVNGWNGAMAAAASEDQFVIYTQEWFSDGIHLGPYGRYHLQRIIKSLSSGPSPVVIQPCQDESLDRARQTFIVNQLLAAGIRDATERVIIAYPRAEGLYGDQAARIFLIYNSGGRGTTGGNVGGGGYGGGGGGGIGFGGIGIPAGGIMGGFRGY
jgi:hypothetical protein